ETVSAGPYHRHVCSRFFIMSYICFLLFAFPHARRSLSTYSQVHRLTPSPVHKFTTSQPHMFTNSHSTPAIEPTIYQYGLARNETRCVAKQKNQCTRQFRGIAQPPK